MAGWCWSWPWGWYILMKEEEPKNGVLKYRFEAPLHTCIGVSRKYYAEPIWFFLAFLVTKKRKVSKISIFFHPFIIEFFWFAYLWLRTEEKIHTVTVVDVSRGEGSFGICSAWEGSKRKDLPGEPGARGNYIG